MSELLREIQQDMRAERIQSMWKRFGKNMVWVSLAIVAGTAAGVIWKSYRESSAMTQTNLILVASRQADAGEYKAAIITYDKLSGSSSHHAIALLGKAAAQEKDGDKDAAKKTLAQLAAMGNISGTELFSDLAKLKLTQADAAIEANSPLHYSLIESKGWVLLDAGKKDEAADQFAALTRDEKTPASMQQRARLALEYIAPEKLIKTKTANE